MLVHGTRKLKHADLPIKWDERKGGFGGRSDSIGTIVKFACEVD